MILTNRLLENRRQARRATAAYTITEVMIAVGFVGVVLATVLSGFSLAFGILQDARENLRAAQIVQEKMETIRLYSWDQINTPGFVPSTFTASANPTNQAIGTIYNGAIVITNAPIAEGYSTNLRQVTVELTWKSAKVERRRTLTTFVSRFGLQNYVY
jgi:type II secretory pathway pseudopilin PulG